MDRVAARTLNEIRSCVIHQRCTGRGPISSPPRSPILPSCFCFSSFSLRALSCLERDRIYYLRREIWLKSRLAKHFLYFNLLLAHLRLLSLNLPPDLIQNTFRRREKRRRCWCCWKAAARQFVMCDTFRRPCHDCHDRRFFRLSRFVTHISSFWNAKVMQSKVGMKKSLNIKKQVLTYFNHLGFVSTSAIFSVLIFLKLKSAWNMIHIKKYS